jgi:hypothetical protein
MHLKHDDVSLCMIPEEIEEMTTTFYQVLFNVQEHTSPAEVVQFVRRKVTDLMNDDLVVPLSAEEVKKAMFMLRPNKALGPDGVTVGFYQKHWQHIKDDMTKAVLHFLNGG